MPYADLAAEVVTEVALLRAIEAELAAPRPCELHHTQTITQWLLHTTDEIINDLTQTAHPAHFHPRSAAFRLIEGLTRTHRQLHQTLHPQPWWV